VAETEGIPVDELVADVKDALVAANVTSTNGAADLRLVSVQMILNVVATKAAGGKVNFQVPFIGTELHFGVRHGQRDTHSIDITLVPPTPDQIQSGAVRSGDFQKTLMAAINRVRQTISSAANGRDPWYLSDATVDISFGVTKEGSISVGAEGNQTSETTNTLRLRLAPPATAAASPSGD
jgi:Trypsin-co-occurring domain 2